MKLPKKNPEKLIWVGGVMVILGWVIPLLITMDYLPSTYFLNFLTFVFQVFGIIIAMLGFTSLVKARRDSEKQKDSIFNEPRHPDDHD